MEIVAGTVGVLVFVGLLWIQFKYWWGGQLTPQPSVDRNLFFGLTGFRKALRIFAGVLMILVSAILFISGNALPGIAAIFLGAMTLATPYMVGNGSNQTKTGSTEPQ